MDLYADKRKPTAMSLLELLLHKRVGESERQPPKIVITGKMALAYRERIKIQLANAQTKKWGWGNWMRRNRRGKE